MFLQFHIDTDKYYRTDEEYGREMNRKIGSICIVLFLIFGGLIGVMNFGSYGVQGTYVKGSISVDTTWDLAGSPYWIEGHVTVPNGVNLTIRPGVDVKFNGYYNIFIEGHIASVGTSSNRIHITSNMTTPAVLDWSSIQINSTGNALFQYCDLRYGSVGVTLYDSSNNTIINNNFWNNSIGVAIYSSVNNNILSNNFSSNTHSGIKIDNSGYNNITGNKLYYNDDCGICLDNSPYNNISNNEIWNSTQANFLVKGFSQDDFNNTISTSNTVNGKPLYYFYNEKNTTIQNLDAGHISLVGSENVTLSNISVKNGDFIYLSYTENSTIMNCNSSNNFYAGIVLFRYAKSNTVEFCNFYFNHYGVSIQFAVNNTLYNNTFSSNLFKGVYIGSVSHNNTVRHNNFINNTAQASDSGPDNNWNHTYSSSPLMGGNYWSDWSPTCTDAFDGDSTPQTGAGGADGICDDQYDIDIDSIDYYPLKNPADTVLQDTSPPVITNLQPPHGSIINNDTLTISANYSDISGIDISSVILRLDGIDITSSATVTESGITYTSPEDIPNNQYLVYIEVRDNSTNHNQANVTWIFTVDTPTYRPSSSFRDYLWIFPIIIIIEIIIGLFFIIRDRKKKVQEVPSDTDKPPPPPPPPPQPPP